MNGALRRRAITRRRATALGLAIALAALSGCASGPPRVGAAWRPAHADAPPSAAPEAPLTAEQRLAEGDRMRRAGRLDRAGFAYLEATRLDPADPRPRERIGALQLSRDPARAAAVFSSLLEAHPESPTAHAGLGLARLAMGEIDGARASLERAGALDPQAAAVQIALGALYDGLGEHERAQQHHERARALRPRDAAVLGNLGLSQFLAGEFADAEQNFRRALLLDPADAALHNQLGLSLARQERYEEALGAFRDAGSEQAAQSNLATAYLLNGDLDRAVAHYEQALLAGGDGELAVLRNLRAAVAARAARP